MIKHLQLKNLKAWRDSGSVRLAPVTMLLGSNSSGKSTLLQSLLLLKQTAAAPDRTVHLNLGGDEAHDMVSLGSFDAVLAHGATPRQFEIVLEFERPEGERVRQGRFACSYGQTASGAVVVQALSLSTVAREMNLKSAQLARAACDKFSTPEKPRYVAGALGPTPKTASISPDVNDPGARNIDFETLRAAYYEQTEALVEGGSDVLLVETIFDTLNAKAALFAIDEFFEKSGERLPIIISGTVTDASGRILSGQTVTAFWHSVRHARPLAIGLNCALGATLMRPYIQELNRVAEDTFISCYPNAGLPNPMSDTGFDETPEVTSRLVHEFAAEGLVNIVGGCCGTTPDHIGAIAKAVEKVPARKMFYAAEA